MKSSCSIGGFVAFLAALALCPTSFSAAARASPGSVLILNQSNAYRPWPHTIINDLRSHITQRFGQSMPVYAENLDLYRFKDTDRDDRLQTYLRDKYRDKSVGVIAVVGPVALNLAVQLRPQLWPGAQIVFVGVDEKTAAQNLPDGVTGVTMRMTLANMVKISRAIVPDVRQFVIVGDRREDRLYHLHFQQEMIDLSRQSEFVDLTGKSLEEVRARVAGLPKDAVVLYIGLHYDGGVTYFSADILGLIAEASNRPIVIDIESLLGHGAVGGLIVSPQRIADDAAGMLIKVLEGQSASTIPITAGQPPQPIFDARALRRWNISTASLPPGSDVRFLEPSIWQLHPVQVAVISFAIVAQALLITWLLFEHRRRRLAEVTARSAMAELAHMDRVATAGVLSASIAHEINQPLMGIVASASAALNWLSGTVPDLDRARLALKKIVDAGHHAGDIVQNIRAMVRKETGSLGSFDINRVIQDVLILLQIDLRENEIAWQLRLEGTLQVTGNRVQIQQVLLNLMANAIDSMSSANARPRLLRVTSMASKPGEVLISIEDNGPGIQTDNLQRIFEPMFTTKSQGMGMGLAICRSIIEAHHGRLWATPRVEGGSIFQFTLPSSGAGNDGGTST